ncbi:MAG: radical SAM protein [bacterium]
MISKVFFVLPDYEAEWKVSLAGITPPTGPTSLYSYAKSINFGNYIFGGCFDFTIHNEQEILKNIKRDDLVCITAIISNYLNALKFIAKVKSRGGIVAIGGPWAAVRAKQIHANHKEIDYIVVGEGEAALKKILIGAAKKGVLCENSIPLCQLPAWDYSGWTKRDLALYQDNYTRLLKSGTYGATPDVIPFFAFYQSSRGCIQIPKCGFCGSRLGKSFVYREGWQFYDDVKKIIEKLNWLNDRIHIFDCSDVFSLQRFKGDLKSFPGLTFTVFLRVDQITPEIAQKLRKLNVVKVSLGIESGSQQILQKIGKGTTKKQNLLAVKYLKDEGIQSYINLMYGLPGEIDDDVKKTVEHFIELAETGDIYRVAGRIVSILPNSKWYFDLIKIRPMLDQGSDILDLSAIQKAWLEEMCPKLSIKDIEKEHAKLARYAKEYAISVSQENLHGVV